MKILIAEDNIAIHEILSEILKDTGHIVTHTYSVENAKKTIEEFNPDVIILDSDINGEQGMDIISDYDEESKMCAIVLTMDLNFTTDNPLVISVLQKPFKNKDILRCLKKKNKLRKNVAKGQKIGDKNVKKPDAKFGTNYIVFEFRPEFVYKLASVFNTTCQILVFSKYGERKIMKKIKKSNKIYKLSGKTNMNANAIDVRRLGTLVTITKEFADEMLQPVVVFDDLKKIIDENGTNATITMLHQIASIDRITIIISTRKSYFTEEEIDTLLCDLKEYAVQ